MVEDYAISTPPFSASAAIVPPRARVPSVFVDGEGTRGAAGGPEMPPATPGPGGVGQAAACLRRWRR